MVDRIRIVMAPRTLAAAAAVALIVAGCSGGSATPAPSAAASAAASGAAASSAQSTAAMPAPTAAPSLAVATQVPAGSCADMAKVGEAVKNADHYVATAKISAAIPGASADGAGISIEMTMAFQKPDRTRISTGGLFDSITVGADTWVSMFGSGQ
jgi:hypothetical protein